VKICRNAHFAGEEAKARGRRNRVVDVGCKMVGVLGGSSRLLLNRTHGDARF
jgi:hypothetical protein